MVEAVEVDHNRLERGRDDGLIEGGEQHSHHESREDCHDLFVAQRPGRFSFFRHLYLFLKFLKRSDSSYTFVME